VTIENAEGNVLRTWNDPGTAFLNQTWEAQWDELSLIFFFGFSVWNYFATPFLLAQPEGRRITAVA
jgi:hypothetical protein